jgi:Methyltransferase domain
MLEVARGKFRPDETVEFQPADATALPFPNASFDSVVCQFGVMFFPDNSVAISAANIRYTEARPIRNWRAIDWQLSDDGGQGSGGGGRRTRRTRCQYYSTRTVNPCLSKIGLAAADVKNSSKRCAAGS